MFFSKLLLIIAGTKALIDRDDHSQRMYRFSKYFIHEKLTDKFKLDFFVICQITQL